MAVPKHLEAPALPEGGGDRGHNAQLGGIEQDPNTATDLRVQRLTNERPRT